MKMERFRLRAIPRVAVTLVTSVYGEVITTQNMAYSSRGMALAFLRGASLVSRFWEIPL